MVPAGAPACFGQASSTGIRIHEATSFFCKACDHAEACGLTWEPAEN